MPTTNLREVGGTVMLAVPPAILDMLGLKAGATVRLSVREGRLVIDPVARPRYPLDDLLAERDPDAPPSEEDLAWEAISPAGREIGP